MRSALEPPVAPMLARLTRDLPPGDNFLYEPKWDGFRAITFREGDDIDIRSRNQRPFARYFPEIVEALRALPETRVVLDGELLVFRDDLADFEALMMRLHPSESRVRELAAETPATYVLFDVLAVDSRDLRDEPFRVRRAVLDELVRREPEHIRVTPATHDRSVAEQWLDLGDRHGIDGVVAKPADLHYEPGRRAMLKVKRERTADCVVAGFRWYRDDPAEVGSLLLGLYDADGALRHVGVVTSFGREQRRRLAAALQPIEVPLAGHPWEHGFGLERSPMGRLKGAAGRWEPGRGTPDWTPLAPTLVAEVAFDAFEGRRFRHPARFKRWRPDRDARSCTFDQLDRKH